MPDKQHTKTHKNTSWLQQWLENIWYEKGRGRFLLLPFSALYCAINFIQRHFQRYQAEQLASLPCPVIVVGNITVGGTGKTPLVVYIVKQLQTLGYKPAIITRGYGGKATTWPQTVTPETDPTLVGDEAVLMARRTNIPVCAGASRNDSIKQLLKSFDIDVIISDDGLQHYKLPRDIQIVVVDASRMFGNGYCLPAGPLRERKSRLTACDLIVLNGGKPSEKGWFTMSLQGELLINLKTGEEKLLSSFSQEIGQEINAVTGIGNPQRFFESLEQAGLSLRTHSFPDHHLFKAADLQVDNDFPIVMTEKDAVKCQRFAANNLWYFPVSAKLAKGFDTQLQDKLKILNKDEDTKMDKKLLDILVCPVTKGPLIYDKKNQELISKSARLAYPIKDGIPVMLEEDARELSTEELER